MDKVFLLAKRAFKKNEVPIGAIVVDENNKIIGKGFNKMESKKCQAFHAEIIAIQAACKQLGGWRLNNCSIYTSLEPCLMCFGLIRQSRISRLIFSLKSPLFGFGKCLNETVLSNMSLKIDFGLKESETLDIIRLFFRSARKMEKDCNEKKI